MKEKSEISTQSIFSRILNQLILFKRPACGSGETGRVYSPVVVQMASAAWDERERVVVVGGERRRWMAHSLEFVG